MDVNVSSLDNAKSLRRGTLSTTPLKGADGALYTMAQGNLIVGGAAASAAGSKVQIIALARARRPFMEYATNGRPSTRARWVCRCAADAESRPQSRALLMMLPSSTPSPLGEPPAGLLDAEALDRLRALDPQGQSGLLQRVLATYATSLRRLLEQLQVARANADVQRQRHVVHTLKSSSASVGALKLSALCAEIETRMRDEPTLSIQSQFDAVTIEAEHLLRQLRG